MMKANKILMMMAMPVAFAACTSEELLPENPGTIQGGERLTVGNVSFVMDDAQTRLAYNSGMKWSEGDLLGAVLMDEVKTTPDWSTTDRPSNYIVTNDPLTNYKYTYDVENRQFTNSNAVFVEGNYFIYGQHREVGRNGLEFEIPAIQESGAKKWNAWAEHQMFIDHVFVAKGQAGKDVAVAPQFVFPVVNFRSTYVGTNNVEIQKIVITDESSKFEVAGQIRPANVTAADYYATPETGVTYASGKGRDNYKVEAGATWDEIFNAFDNAYKEVTLTEPAQLNSAVLGDFFSPAEVDDQPKSMTLKYTKDTQKDGSVDGFIVMPLTGSHSKDNVVIEIYTNKGMVTLAGAETEMSEAFDLDSETGVKDFGTIEESDKGEPLAIAKKSITYTGVKAALFAPRTAGQQFSGDNSRVEIKFKDDAILVPAQITVSSTEELEYYLENWYTGAKAKQASVAVTAAPGAEEKVEITNKVIAFMAGETNPALTFTGDIVIPSTVTEKNVLDKITPSGTLNVINESADQTWTKNADMYNTVTNNSGATLNITGANGSSATEFEAVITNLGTVSISKNANIEGDFVNGATGTPGNETAKLKLEKTILLSTLTNYAIVEVEGEATIFTVNNKKTLNVTAGSLKATGTFTNDGSVVVSDEKTLNLKESLTNNGSIQVGKASAWTVEGATTNKGTLTVGENTTWTTNGTLDNNGTITIATGATWTTKAVNNKAAVKGANPLNAGEVTNNGNINLNGKFTNHGTVTNSGRIGSQPGGEFENRADMVVNGNSTSLLTTNTADGEIVVDGYYALNVTTQNGKITYVVSSDVDLKGTPEVANSLKITASSIDLANIPAKDNTKNTVKYVEFVPEGSSMTIDGADKSIANVKFTGSGVSFTLNGTLTATAELKVDANTSVLIDQKLTYSGDATAFSTTGSGFDNNGELLIVGTLNFSGFESTGKPTDFEERLGAYLFTGGGTSNITYKQ